MAEFYEREVYSRATNQHETRLFVRIPFASERNTESPDAADRMATERDKATYPADYARYLRSKEPPKKAAAKPKAKPKKARK